MKYWSINVDVESHPMGHVSKLVTDRPDLNPDVLDALEQAGVTVRVDLVHDTDEETLPILDPNVLSVLEQAGVTVRVDLVHDTDEEDTAA